SERLDATSARHGDGRTGEHRPHRDFEERIACVARDGRDHSGPIERHSKRAKTARRSTDDRTPFRRLNRTEARVDFGDDLVGEIALVRAVSNGVDELTPAETRHAIGKRENKRRGLALDDLSVEILNRVLSKGIVADDSTRRSRVSGKHQDEWKTRSALVVAGRQIDDHLTICRIAEGVVAKDFALKEEP